MNSIPIPRSFGLDNRMTVVLFAGMGGGCDGLEDAGFHVHLAVNHDPLAIAMHEKRHPHTRHLRCDVFEVDPVEATRGRGVRILHASPDCTHFSVAKGSKPVSKRRRSLAWVIPRWAGTVRPEVITMENVREIKTWGPLICKRDKKTGRAMRRDGSIAAEGERIPVQDQWLIPDPKHKGRIWRAWLKHMHGLGYSFEDRILVCADYGIPTIRKRFFGVARSDGGPIYWPDRTHAPRDKAKALKLKPWVGADTIIDWSLPVKSIFDRKKPLAPATLRRIARGVMRYVVNAKHPFIVPITHTKGTNTSRSSALPLNTLTTAKGGELALVVPSIAGVGGRMGQSVERSVEEPIQAVTTKADSVLVSAHLSTMRNAQKPFGAADEPLHTLTAGGAGVAVVAAFLAQHNNDIRREGGVHPGRGATEPMATLTVNPQQGVVTAALTRLRGNDKDGQDICHPLPTQTCGGGHEMLIMPFLQAYYGSGSEGGRADDPLRALTGLARHGLVTVEVNGQTMVITDICMRMLDPLEGAAAHGFDPTSFDHVIEFTDERGKRVKRKPSKRELGHLVGNSVPKKMITLLAECNGRYEFVEAAE
ncbi:DNA cytosine methyltransferase [Rhizobium sp. BK060]|uniref:DNA cytosine methyltransferase n=1 Tax=Rhizobium sp. BK060 TaxID=2587096 RepID=UPI001621C1FD|nr:DNA cytosine methyltransferase [Rhizobium sp. BK060]MBB3396857.1 DNA (cytosine-5)-methyltransferase 1 [Rhizobium sp. BK060]